MSTDVSSYDPIPVDVAVAEPTRPRLLLQGTSLASAAIVMGFMGLIAVYVAERAEFLAREERWLPDGVSIPLTQPNFMGLTLCLSVITIWWTVQAVRNDDRGHAFVGYLLSLLFAFAFLAQTAYLLTLMELQILVEPRAVLFFAIIGLHMALMVVAMVFAVVMLFRTLGGEYSSRNYEGVLSAALFWTMTVALYGVLWYAIYITK